VRGGLRDTFAGTEDIVVVGEAGDGAGGVERAELLAADVVLMDLRMPGMDGVATHLQHIYDKLGARDRASAVAEGYRRRLLT
jgi:DNA-binding NarL/FixJ family response regulator